MLRKFVGDSLIYMVGMVLTRGLSILLLPVYTRFLHPSDYGIIAVCTSVYGVLSMFAGLALDTAIVLFYFQLEREEYRKFLSTVWVTLFLAPLALAGLGELFGPAIGARLFPSVPWDPYLRLAVWITCVSGAITAPLALMQAEQRPRSNVMLSLASSVATAGTLILFVVVLRRGALGSLQAQLIGGIVMAAVSHWIILRFCRFRIAFRWNYLSDALRLCLPLLPHALCLWLLNVSDRWILARYVSLADLGLYNLAYTLGMTLYSVGMGCTTALQPLYFRDIEDPAFQGRFPRMLTGYVAILMWLALALSLMAPEILRIMTRPQYYGAARLVPWIAAGYLFWVALYQVDSIAIAQRKRTYWAAWITGPAAAANIALNLWLVPRYGVVMAAINTLTAFVIAATSARVLTSTLKAFRFPWGEVAGMGAVAAVVFWIGAAWLSPGELWAGIAVKGALLLAGGAVMAYVAGVRVAGVRSLLARVAVRETPA